MLNWMATSLNIMSGILGIQTIFYCCLGSVSMDKILKFRFTKLNYVQLNMNYKKYIRLIALKLMFDFLNA